MFRQAPCGVSRQNIRARDAVTQKRASRPARHSFVQLATRHPDKSCKAHVSTNYHKGWVCVATSLLCMVTVCGLAKLHTPGDAFAALWMLLGAFLLAGWPCTPNITCMHPCISSSPSTANHFCGLCRSGISSLPLPHGNLRRREHSCGGQARL